MVKLSGREHGIRKSTLLQDQLARSEELSSDLHGWQCSPWRFLVNRRELHLSSSRRTSSSAPRAESRNILNSTEIHGRDQKYTYDLGCVARKPCRRWLERWCGSKFIGLVDWIHEVHDIEWETFFKGCMWSGKRLTQIQATTTPGLLWPEIWCSLPGAAQPQEKQQSGQSINRSSTMRGSWKTATLSIRMMESRVKKRTEKVGTSDGSCHAL